MSAPARCTFDGRARTFAAREAGCPLDHCPCGTHDVHHACAVPDDDDDHDDGARPDPRGRTVSAPLPPKAAGPTCAHCGAAIVGFAHMRGGAPERYCGTGCMDRGPRAVPPPQTAEAAAAASLERIRRLRDGS